MKFGELRQGGSVVRHGLGLRNRGLLGYRDAEREGVVVSLDPFDLVSVKGTGPTEVPFGGGIIAGDQQLVAGIELPEGLADEERRPRADLAGHVQPFHVGRLETNADNADHGSCERSVSPRSIPAGEHGHAMNLGRALGLGDDELVSFVGAGGKKTAMRRLVREAGDRSVAYTTTTNMPPPTELPLMLLSPSALAGMDRSRSGPLAIGAGSIDAPKRVPVKVRGFEPETIDELAGRGVFDWVLVKADGARRRELTAPADHEPAIPTKSSVVVVVVSVEAVGERLDSGAIHRPDRVAALTGLERGDPVSVEAIAKLLAHEKGGLKAVPTDARAVLLINKADTPTARDTAAAIVEATASRTDRYRTALVTSFDRNVLNAHDEMAG